MLTRHRPVPRHLRDRWGPHHTQCSLLQPIGSRYKRNRSCYKSFHKIQRPFLHRLVEHLAYSYRECTLAEFLRMSLGVRDQRTRVVNLIVHTLWHTNPDIACQMCTKTVSR